MPLPKPTLDNRSFDQLVGEGRALIPRLAPQWTDHNASDPGITLLELAAWLSEQNIFRFDRFSDEASRAFVRLVGLEPRMPTVAQTVVEVVNNNTAGVNLSARVQLASATAPMYETTDAVFASPAKLVCVLSGNAALTNSTLANQDLQEFPAFGNRPRKDYALYLGFDRALDATNETITLYIWTNHSESDADERGRLIAEQHDWQLHYRVRTIWEFRSTSGTWLPLDGVIDETRALTLSGFVRFTAPINHTAGGPGPEFFIRCRILSGRFECPPSLRHIAINAVSCEHALSCGERQVGIARGHASATFALSTSAVVAGSVSLRLDDGAGGIQDDWREAPDFERAGAHERVFVLDPERGELQSGDGLRGAVLPSGYALRASFRIGGGVAGNLPAGELRSIPANAQNLALIPELALLPVPMLVAQPFAASGGAPRETLSSAQARAFDVVNSVDKAVTLSDFERLALGTPGIPIARVRAIANMQPQLPCYPAPGSVTLIVIPQCPRPAPLPSQALLDALLRYLEPRRLVTSEVHATAPHYRRVAVQATLSLECDADAEQVLSTAETAIDQFLDPLDGGPDGKGWPFGRTVYRTELMALLADTPGVARVTALTLQTNCDGECASCGGGGCGNVELCAHELVVPGRHMLNVESDITPGLKRSIAHECESA